MVGLLLLPKQHHYCRANSSWKRPLACSVLQVDQSPDQRYWGIQGIPDSTKSKPIKCKFWRYCCNFSYFYCCLIIFYQSVFFMKFKHRACVLLGLAILVSWFVDNLLLCYLIGMFKVHHYSLITFTSIVFSVLKIFFFLPGSTALLMVGLSCPQSDSVSMKSSFVKPNPKK